jgi:LysM repeat protein
MTAISLPAPHQLRPARRAASGTTRAIQRNSRAALVRRPRPAAERLAVRRRPSRVRGDGLAAGQARPLRLTRRGRLVITATLTAAGIGATMFTGAVSLAGTQAQHPPVRYVTVAPGDTLWSIAGEAAPGEDRRDTVHRIVDLNALRDASLSVGQRVAVPVGG